MTKNSNIKCNKVLFFGRDGCKHSEEVLNRLKDSGFDVTHIVSKQRGEELPVDALTWEGNYIICFRSLFILPKELLERASITAINFHPGPPEYPGSGCINFALLDGVTTYGVTAHEMNEKVDNGEIFAVERFEVEKKDSLMNVLSKTHEALFSLAIKFVDLIAVHGEKFHLMLPQNSKSEFWRGEARKISELDALQIINPSINKEELENAIRAIHSPSFPLLLELHGYKFALLGADEAK